MNLQQSKTMPETEGNILCTEARGLVTYEYYVDIYLARLEKIIQEFGKARLLFFYPDPDNFKGWEKTAADVDFSKFNEYSQYIEKVALINPPKSVSQRWDFRMPILSGEFREFEKVEDLAEALEWIRA